MKHIKLFEELFEASKFPHDKDMEKISKLRIEIMDISDKASEKEEEGPKWQKLFIKLLKASGYDVFNKNLTNFKPEECDVLMAPENYPGDGEFEFFINSKIQFPVKFNKKGDIEDVKGDMSWKEFYETYGPKEFPDDAIIIARKKNSIQFKIGDEYLVDGDMAVYKSGGGVLEFKRIKDGAVLLLSPVGKDLDRIKEAANNI